MNSPDMSLENKLDELFHDGRINRQEYDRLREALKGKPVEKNRVAPDPYIAGRPWQIVVVAIVLGFVALFDLASISHKPNAFLQFAIKCLFIYGLLQNWLWVFILFLILSGFAAASLAVTEPLVALMDLGLFLLVLSAWRFYFANDRARGIEQ